MSNVSLIIISFQRMRCGVVLFDSKEIIDGQPNLMSLSNVMIFIKGSKWTICTCIFYGVVSPWIYLSRSRRPKKKEKEKESGILMLNNALICIEWWQARIIFNKGHKERFFLLRNLWTTINPLPFRHFEKWLQPVRSPLEPLLHTDIFLSPWNL